MALVYFSWMVSFTMLYTVELSVCMGVDFCGCPIYSMVNLIGSPDLVPQNNAPTSASAADDITFFMMFERVRTAPLDSLLLLKCFDTKNKFPPAPLLMYISERYDKFLCMCNVMPLV